MKQDGEWVTREVRIPKGARPGSSKATPGAESALLFKSGKTVGPAEMRVPKGDSDSDLAEKVVGLALTATAALVLNYGPEIKAKLTNDVIPAAKAQWNKRFKAKGDGSSAVEAAAEDLSADGEADAPVGVSDLKGPDLGPLGRHPEGRFGHGRTGRFGRPDMNFRTAGGHERPEASPRQD